MEIWRTEVPHEHGFVEDGWVRDQTQCGDVHKNPGPSNRPMRNQRRMGVNRSQSGQPSTLRLRYKRRPHWPNPTAWQARAPEPHQKIGKTSSSAQTTEKTMSGSGLTMASGIAALPSKDSPARVMMALKHRAGIEACQPIAGQVASMGMNLPNPTPTSTQTTNAATPALTTAAATKTPRQAAAGRTTPAPMPCGREIRRFNKKGVCTFLTHNAIFWSFPKLQVLIHQGVCVCARACVLRDTITPHCVASTCTGWQPRAFSAGTRHQCKVRKKYTSRTTPPWSRALMSWSSAC